MEENREDRIQKTEELTAAAVFAEQHPAPEHYFCEQCGDCTYCDPEHDCSVRNLIEIRNSKRETGSTPILYDADGEHRLTFQTERKGVMYPVAIVLGETALKEESILDFERDKDQRISDATATESNEKDAAAVSSQAYQAAVKFGRKHLKAHEGYANKPSERDLAFAVQTLLFGVEFEELPVATSDQPCPDEDDDTSTYRLKCFSNGKILITEHVVKAATKDQIAEVQALQSRVLLVQGANFGKRDQRIPSKAKRWGEIYDSIKVEAKGYSGRVPLHHKKAIAERHLKNEQEAITGN